MINCPWRKINSVFIIKLVMVYICFKVMISIGQSFRTSERPYHAGSIEDPLEYIPGVFVSNYREQRIPSLSQEIMDRFLKLPEMEYSYKIVILTPVRNVEETLDSFQEQLANLSYPHDLLSLYFGEDGSEDRTVAKAQAVAKELKFNSKFSDAQVIQLNISGGIHGNEDQRHEFNVQYQRRAHLARARNLLLEHVLVDTQVDYVLYIDGDIIDFPQDLIEQMLYAKSDVVTTICLRRNVFKWKYDSNSWQETPASIEYQSLQPPGALIVEGYSQSYRLFLWDLRAKGRVVPLDGVGGCSLMIKADCFRLGLRFPEVVYKRHIETEGLAKMALDMGFSVVGLPFVEVFHK